MTFTFEKPEPRIARGANWGVLEYLIERFNRQGLDGNVALRRTLMMRDLQLCLAGECRGVPLSVMSESFDEKLILDASEKDRLVALVSRFLLRIKHLHNKRCPGSSGSVPEETDVVGRAENENTDFSRRAQSGSRN